jgi:hypothetical protein
MIVTVKSAVKLRKKPDAKSVVWVQFRAPPSHAGFKMQLYPRSHESSRGVGQGHDSRVSILSALARTCPNTVTFLDLGITELTSAKVTRLLLCFWLSQRYLVGLSLLLPLSMIPKLSLMTTERHAHLTSLQRFRLSTTMMTLPHRTVIPDDTSSPDGYTRYTPDPSHRGGVSESYLK